jgi:short-subunit dehydrogenase
MKYKKILFTGSNGSLGKFLSNSLEEHFECLHLVRKIEKEHPRVDQKFIEIDLGEKISDSNVNKISDFNPDIFIDIAGIQGMIGFSERIQKKDYETSFNINFYNFLEIIGILLPLFKKKNFGRVVSYSGGGVTAPRPFFSAYACSKIAKYKLMENLAEECIDYDIKLNMIAPGIIQSNLQRTALTSGYINDQEMMKVNDAYQKQDEILFKNLILIKYLISRELKVSGRIISAIWDSFKNIDELNSIPLEFGKLTREII